MELRREPSHRYTGGRLSCWDSKIIKHAKEEIDLFYFTFVFSGCSFLTKTISAEKAGALAAIIFDNKRDNDDSMIDMIKDETDRTTTIPSFFLLGKDGYEVA